MLPCRQIKLIAIALTLTSCISGLAPIQAQPLGERETSTGRPRGGASQILSLPGGPPSGPRGGASRDRFTFPLRDRGIPTGRPRGGASRGQCPPIVNEDKPLTALVPTTQKTLQGQVIWESWDELTVAESPTLWFYVPYSLNPQLPIEFVLQDEVGNDVYKTFFRVSELPLGIVKFRLPAMAAPLEVDKRYHWYFSIDCDLALSPLVEGWVKRVAINSSLMSQLQKATPQERAALYAANGIWHDALTTLAEPRQTNPRDTTLTANWVSLLQSVGLEAVAREPISQCCTPDQ